MRTRAETVVVTLAPVTDVTFPWSRAFGQAGVVAADAAPPSAVFSGNVASSLILGKDNTNAILVYHRAWPCVPGGARSPSVG